MSFYLYADMYDLFVRSTFIGWVLNAVLRVYRESAQSVIVLCNLDPLSASRMADWLDTRMTPK